MPRTLVASPKVPASKSSSSEGTARSLNQGEIARIAYQFFEERGRIHGFDREDWLRAEELIRQQRRRPSS